MNDMEPSSSEDCAADLEAELLEVATAIRRKGKQMTQLIAELGHKSLVGVPVFFGRGSWLSTHWGAMTGGRRHLCTRPRLAAETEGSSPDSREAVAAVGKMYLAADDTECSSAVTAECSDGARKVTLRAAAKYLVEYRLCQRV